MTYFPAKTTEYRGIVSQEIALEELVPLFPSIKQNHRPEWVKANDLIKTDIKENGLKCPLTVISLPKEYDSAKVRKQIIDSVQDEDEGTAIWSRMRDRLISEDMMNLLPITGIYIGNQRYSILKELGATSTDVFLWRMDQWDCVQGSGTFSWSHVDYNKEGEYKDGTCI